MVGEKQPPPTPQTPVRNDIKLQGSPFLGKKSYSLKSGSFLGFLPLTPSKWGFKEEIKIESSSSSQFYPPPPPPKKNTLVVECSFQDLESEEKPKTCDTREWGLFQKTESRRHDYSQHLSSGRAAGRAPIGRAPPGRAPIQESARSRVPCGPYIEEGINFHFPATTPVSGVQVKWSQLWGPGSILGISSLIHGGSSSEDCSPSTCNNTVTSDSDTSLQLQYKIESLSATGSSKTPLHCMQAYYYIRSNASNYPYKTPLQECFEHCLGTVSSLCQGVLCDSPTPQAWPTGRALSTGSLLGSHRCVVRLSNSSSLANWTRALYWLSTWLSQVCCATLQLLKPGQLDARSLLALYLALTGVLCDSPTPQAWPTGRALSTGSLLGSHRCVVRLSNSSSLANWTRALYWLSTWLSQVCGLLDCLGTVSSLCQGVLCDSPTPQAWPTGRALSTGSLLGSHRCVVRLSNSSSLANWTRALYWLSTWLSQVCCATLQLLKPGQLDARSLLALYLALTGVLCDSPTPQAWPTGRALSTGSLLGSHRCVVRLSNSSSLANWTRALYWLSTWLSQVCCATLQLLKPGQLDARSLLALYLALTGVLCDSPTPQAWPTGRALSTGSLLGSHRCVVRLSNSSSLANWTRALYWLSTWLSQVCCATLQLLKPGQLDARSLLALYLALTGVRTT